MVITESQVQPSTSIQQAPPTGINTAPLATNTGALGSAASGGSVAANNSNPLAALPTYSSFGNSVYPGRATFITPTRTRSMNPLYRIDPRENVTFAWEFKDLKIRPINMTLAAVGPNSVTYTISVMDGGQTGAVWHLSKVPAHTQLMNGYYGIQLYDQRGISAYHQPGWLSPQTQLTIALYTTSKYQNSTETTEHGFLLHCLSSKRGSKNDNYGRRLQFFVKPTFVNSPPPTILLRLRVFVFSLFTTSTIIFEFINIFIGRFGRFFLLYVILR
ncbi:hypothetical protein BJV82DRAFT_657715 [Fennellomyces sp. T-0311]|nr:hypothetical protein BJV82DRAFT_657715 [Fennellomyces sp. T-0311]